MEAALAAGYAALKADPDNSFLAEDLAERLKEAGRDDEAVTVLEAALARQSESRRLRRTLAKLLPGTGRGTEAEAHWRELLLLDARDDEAMMELAVVLCARGAFAEAIDLLQRALRIRPNHPTALFRLGSAWAELGEGERAGEAFRRCLSVDPVDPLGAGEALARLSSDPLTPAYVRTLFDQYADKFDQDLLGSLSYRAPQLVRAAAQAVLGATTRIGRVLDLGCGTGLAGAVFRDIAAELDGVDLSPRMVDEARKKGIYDALFVEDAVAFLGSANEAYDFVVAADVAVYIGELAPLFGACRRALRRGGHFALTVEEAQGDGFVLGPKRRYAHSRSYIERTSAAAGLHVAYHRSATLRTEARAEVRGCVFVLAHAG